MQTKQKNKTNNYTNNYTNKNFWLFKKNLFLHLNLVALPTISRYVIKNSCQIKSNTQTLA